MEQVTEAPTALNWWDNQVVPAAPAGYPELVDAVRTLQDRIAAAVPGDALVADLTRRIARINRDLDVVATDEPSQLSGRLIDLPGRGQVLIPTVHVLSTDQNSLRGRVRFGRHYLGANGAVHGGAIPLLFDDLLGRFASGASRGISRTAYLHIDYRSVTPIDTDLHIEVRFTRVEGRKQFVYGALLDGDRLCAEADALFVELRPGQA